MNYPLWHEWFCEASNKLGDAAERMRQAAYQDGDNAAFLKLADAMSKIRKRCFTQWERNCKRCKKMGCK